MRSIMDRLNSLCDPLTFTEQRQSGVIKQMRCLFMPTLHAVSIRNLTSSISHFPVMIAASKVVVVFWAPAGPLMALEKGHQRSFQRKTLG